MKDIGRTGRIHILEEGILLSEKVTTLIHPGFLDYRMITIGAFRNLLKQTIHTGIMYNQPEG